MKNKLMILTGALIVILAISVGLQGRTTNAAGQTVWAFGDSIMAGSVTNQWRSTAYPTLGATIPEMAGSLSGTTITNYSIGGSVLRAHPTAPTQMTLKKQIQNALASTTERPTTAIILIGHNDIYQFAENYNLNDPNSLELSKWEAVYADQALRDAGVAKVYWITPMPRTTTTQVSDVDSLAIEHRRDWYNEWLSAWLAPQGRIIDTRGLLGEKIAATNRSELANTAFFTGDGLHLNAAGNAQIAPAVAAKIR
ncbi:SGNH/GDSL hydrolase family protein [Candidatus Saccharibacteria bacterium]|nr:MAG: SGNH/GDSL hydrolase family protein [Candidatus Saccharibacteria bacterium]